ncbi:energy transducer TonB [Maribellus maritimus]|uniref:energy transducer TonB n=1 Tax=Maribellus maritimus TaxID=2870838 RepID=UPI001EEBD7EB|nr:energy transducer TonB [Maribellus maritimus]MCG6187108.1 energy transducer TonB [Maribellus maritimus]
MKKTITSLFAVVFAMFFVFGASAQKHMHHKNNYMISDLERMEDENMDYLNQIYKIVKDYPAFSYTYRLEDGKVKNVVVEGVNNNLDRKRLEIVLFDLKTNKNRMKNKANRMGVFYSVDEQAEYEDGWESLKTDILSNLNYADEAKNWGVEGTVFVKFVVDENGEIPFISTSTNMESPIDMHVDKLEQAAAEAIKATSGDWEPSEVENEEVASLLIIPVTFDVKKSPFLPTMIL